MPEILPESLTPGQSRPRNRLARLAAFTVRLIARVSLTIWFGGFTFYAAVVVPDLHEHLGGMETGEISRRVAWVLYAAGGLAVVLGWLEILTDRGRRWGWLGKTRMGLLVVNSVLLVTLILMHRSLSIRLDTGAPMEQFRSFHEVYLTTWTIQWLSILGLLAIDSTAQRLAVDPVSRNLLSPASIQDQ